jgi:hypothetical protein
VIIETQDIEDFFSTLLLGDFNEHQNTPAQLVGGLISLIPILGQVMAARDITGTLFSINKHGGFGNATSEQLVNLGFAAFGAIPEVGSAFKTVFKPLWKERQLARGAVHSGAAAIEGLLGLSKGGAITWVRKELIGKWAARTQQMIAVTLSAMDMCIGLTEFVATAGGWQGWLIPDSVQALAREMLPGLRTMRGQVTVPLTRASNEIKAFLEDLLGERAAGIVMAVGGNVVAASAVPATRTRAGHNAADVHPKGKAPARQEEVYINATPKAEASKGSGPIHTTMQVTRKAFQDLATTQAALVGEHMADYHELKRFGGSWVHDKSQGQWSPATIAKLNADKRPVNLGELDLKKVTHKGIDAVWGHNGRYTAVEAKARASVFAVAATVKSMNEKGMLPAPARALSVDLQMLWVLLPVTNRGAEQLVQMSDRWVIDRATREGLDTRAEQALLNGAGDRRVVLVTFESAGSPEHGQALIDILRGKPESEVPPHAEHGITREWGAEAIDVVVGAQKEALRTKTGKVAAKPTVSKSSKSPSK